NANRRPACALSCTVRASVRQLFVGRFLVSSGLALSVALFEARHAATAVQDLLLTRVEGVALRAHLDGDVTAVFGAARLERVTATAEHGGLRVGGMNVSFHDVLFDRLSPWAASCGRWGRTPNQRRFWR